MTPTEIAGANVTLGAPADWDEAVHGPCETLKVRHGVVDGLPLWQSAWLPTEVDLAKLNAGKPVIITIIGQTHPPIALEV